MTRPNRRTGTVLSDTWRLDAAIGAGGMASVFAATHVRNRLRVAIKLLHPELGRNEAITARFLREGYVANRVEHPGVVRILDDGIDGDDVYLVMELLQGTTVKQLWEDRDRRMPADEVERLVRSVLGILEAAHAAGVVHRDLKPDNVFCSVTGEVKLLDFGIARLHEDAAMAAHATATGATLGTPAFMPPEQALGRWDQVDGRADLFALAATAWMLLTGKLLHEATTIPELLIAAATKPARPIATMGAVPPRLAAVLDRALAFSREDRWPDATAMLRALDDPALLVGRIDALPPGPSSQRADTVTAIAVAGEPTGDPRDAAEIETVRTTASALLPTRAPRPTTRLSAPGSPSAGGDERTAPITTAPRHEPVDEPLPDPTMKMDVSAYRSRSRPTPRAEVASSYSAVPAADARWSVGGAAPGIDPRSTSTPTVAPDGARSLAPSRSSRGAWMAVVAAIALALVIVVVLLVAKDGPTPVARGERPGDAKSAANIAPPASPPASAPPAPPVPEVTPSAPSPDVSATAPAPSTSSAPRPPAAPTFVTKRVCGKEVDFNGEQVCHDVRVPVTPPR